MSPQRRARLPAQNLFATLVALHLAAKAALWAHVARAPLSGDEGGYRDGALALRNLVYDLAALQAPDTVEIKANLVSNGWFMPGMSALLAPLYVVVPDAGVMVVRTYVGVLSSALLVGLALWLRRRFGYAYACALMVMPGLVPMWLVFSFTIWGDLVAGMVVVAILITLDRLIRALAANQQVRVRDGALLGFLAAACLYLRSSALPLVAGILVLLALATIVLGRRATLTKGISTTAAALAVFAALLAPWSLATSKALDARVTTTTTMSLSLAVTFGDVDELCFGPCPTARPSGSPMVWFDGVRYSREVAAATGRSEVDIQRAMAAYALRDLTPTLYAEQVLRNYRAYLLSPTAFAPRFFTGGEGRPPVIVVPTNAMMLAGAAMMALAMLDLRRVALRDRLIRTLIKLLMLASLLQPFVHPGSGRYWPLFAPLIGLAGAYVTTQLAVRRSPRPPHTDRALAVRAVTTLDLAATAFPILVGLGLALLAAS